MRTISKGALGFLATTVTLALAGCGADGEGAAFGPAETAEVTGPTEPGTTPCEGGKPGELPEELSCTGLFSVWNETVASSNAEFKPAVRLWSDGAEKRRWIYLPAGSQIDSSDMDEWKFPVGTKLWKEFSFNGKHVETRMFWKTSAQHWARTTYRWSDDQTTARRFETGDLHVDVGAATPYEIPGTDQCDSCHEGRQDKILGFDAVALGLPGATGLTLAQLVADRRLTRNPPATTLAIPEDATGKAAAAIGYLHANCGTTCHNRNETAFCNGSGLFFRLSYTDVATSCRTVADLDVFKTAVNVPAPAAGPEYLRIAPGDVAHSGIVHLMSRRADADGGLQMPLIDTHAVDHDGVAALTAWIQAMTP